MMPRWRLAACRAAHVVLLGAAIGTTGSACAARTGPAAGAAIPADGSPHRVLNVAVEPSVSLEVLDWGGRGTPMIFLTGLGNSAHVFDGFAPRFRDGWRPIGVTRRGFGGSSRPAGGYDLHRRARDVLAVMDSLAIPAAVLVGHSLAADEMSFLAARHPERVHALVYLDAYDYGPEFVAMRDGSPDVPPDPVPAMTAADSASAAAFMAYRERAAGIVYPAGEVLAHTLFDADGRFQGFAPRNHRDVGGALGRERADYPNIAAPALGIFADVPSVRAAFPRYDAYDAATRAAADSAFAMSEAWRRRVIARFGAELRRGRMHVLPDAHHYVFLSNADQVERLMRQFVATEVAAHGKPVLPPALQQLDAFLATETAAGRFSGTVSVDSAGTPLYRRAFGQADRRRGIANAVDTRFNIGSMDKMFTAVAIMQLVAEGRIRLDDPLSCYIPDFPDSASARKIRVEHLLTHSSGLGTYHTPRFFRERPQTVPGLVDVARDNASLAFEPGTRFLYSNTGYLLLGAIIERVTGTSYYDHVRDRVFIPAGMISTGSPTRDALPQGVAVAHAVQGDSVTQMPYHRGAPSGGALTTVGDMARFGRALMTGTLLPAAMVEEMTTPKPALASPGYGYGFGGMLTAEPKIVGHNGGLPGVFANFDLYPASGYSTVVLMNVSTGRPQQAYVSALRTAVSDLLAGSTSRAP